MGEVVKIGSFPKRVAVDTDRRVIRYMQMRMGVLPVPRSMPADQVKQFRIRELVTPLEEVQLQNRNVEVQKDRRAAELWLDLKDGQSELLGEFEQAGLLLMSVHEAAQKLNVPVVSERAVIGQMQLAG